MKEQLIEFKTAKLAKEKGFTQLFGKFDLVNMFRENKDGSIESDKEMQGNERDRYYLRPTQSLLQKWLRENHKIHITIWYNELTEKYRIDSINSSEPFDMTEYPTYEQVLEIALVEALNLIK